MGSADRLRVRGLSKGGKRLTVWADLRDLCNFRVKPIHAEMPESKEEDICNYAPRWAVEDLNKWADERRAQLTSRGLDLNPKKRADFKG
jgi:hypothetical protein